nr:restriction endonuclease subunit S [Agrobacterium salinitolerans]
MRVTAEASGSEGQPWTLPEGWCWAVLGDLANLIRGVSYKKEQSTSEYTREKIPLLRGNNIQSGYIDNTELIYVNSDCVSPPQILDESDIILTMSSGSISLIGKSAYFTSPSEKVTFGAFCGCLRSKDIIFARWIYHYLQTSYYRKKISTAAKGTSLNNLKRDHLLSLPIPFCTPENIQQICHKVDRLMAEVENGEAALEEARKGLETFRRALLKSAVTGELTRDWRENNQPNETGHDLLARIKAERDATPKSGRGKKAAASPPLDASDLPELPEGWAWARLGQLLSHLTSGSRDWAEYYDKGSKVFVMAQNVRPGRFNHAYTKHVDPPDHLKDVKRSRIQRDDLLITIVGANTGDVCRVNFEATDFFVCQSVALMRPALAELSQYLEMYLIAPDGGRRDMEKVIYGAGRPHLSFDQIEALLIPIPPPAEMLEILGRTSGLLSAYSDTLMMLEAETADAARLRQAVLKAAFEGKLVPQDPADEPASGLLSRLKAQESANLKQTKRRKKV